MRRRTSCEVFAIECRTFADAGGHGAHSGRAGSDMLEYDGLRARYLPAITMGGRTEHRISHYALYATACLRG